MTNKEVLLQLIAAYSEGIDLSEKVTTEEWTLAQQRSTPRNQLAANFFKTRHPFNTGEVLNLAQEARSLLFNADRMSFHSQILQPETREKITTVLLALLRMLQSKNLAEATASFA